MFCAYGFSCVSLYTKTYTYANSVDPDEIAHTEPSYLDLHSLPFHSRFLLITYLQQLICPNPRRGRQHSFMEIDHEIFSMVILSLPLIQEGQLSVSGERMCTILVHRLED